MFRPSIQKLHIIVLMALLCVAMVAISLNSKFIDKKDYYYEKAKAAEYMQYGLDILKSASKRIFKNNTSSFDPMDTGLVFFEDELEGSLNSKLTTLNPNFAALIVDFITDSGIEPVKKTSDYKPKIAVSFTGSMPGANLAVLSACEAMGLEPVIITSVSASNFGALRYKDFSWLDMEYELTYPEDSYFKHRSVAASIGKRRDSGIGLSNNAIKDIVSVLDKYQKIYGDREFEILYRPDKYLPYYIDRRMDIYDEKSDGAPYDLFINVGGGVASVGYYAGIKKVSGFVSADSLKNLYKNKSINDCVMHRFSDFENNPVPAINIVDIENLVKDSLPLITLESEAFDSSKIVIGEGSLFSEEKYNLVIVVPCLIISLIVVLSVGVLSHFQIKRRMSSYEPDSIS